MTSNGGAPVIRVDHVSRWFGSVVAVSEVTFDIKPGITGLLGPNGAGKTTLLRMMTGLADVSDGSVTMFGEPVRDNPPLYRRIGVMSEHETVYGFMKGRDFVRMMGRLRGVTDLDAAVDRAIGLVDLADAAHRPLGTYSRGMRQRMRLALASYNVGLGHVYDAQRLAKEQGLDPNKWFENVEKAMLLLKKPEYARRARHGFCRGDEPVRYVSHIQALYDAYVEAIP